MEVNKERIEALREVIYDDIRIIQDPEYPHTLEELEVVNEDGVLVSQYKKDKVDYTHVLINIKPTVPHCSMTALIGLSIRYKLSCTSPDIKLDLLIEPGTHDAEKEINRQINDKERVIAALENPRLLDTVKRLCSYEPND